MGKRNVVFAWGVATALAGVAVSVTAAETEVALGLGVGALYSGLGANVALKDSQRLAYVSAGFVALGYSDAHGGWITPFGVGAGVVWTDLFPFQAQRHAVGVYLGAVGWRGRTNTHDEETVYGAGATYLYVPRGLLSPGWSFGATPAVGDDNGKTRGYLMFNLGHQF